MAPSYTGMLRHQCDGVVQVTALKTQNPAEHFLRLGIGSVSNIDGTILDSHRDSVSRLL